MIRAYIDYWKKSFNYTEDVSINEFLIAFTFNVFILIIIWLSGIFVPITWENTFIDFWYTIMYLMIIPTISLVIRVIRAIVKK